MIHCPLRVESHLYSGSSVSFTRSIRLRGPSRVVAKIIKDLAYYGRTPIFLAARSPHMEDIGAFQALCYDKKERLEMMNWPLEVALEFARRNAERVDLCASDLDVALQSMVQLSGGNPGGILGMLHGQPRPVSSRQSNQVSRSLSELPNGAPLGQVANPTNAETIEQLLERESMLLQRMAEDMQRYSMKHDALRRHLASDEERDAALKALLSLVGHRSVTSPWRVEYIL
jgi:hypothetical protein